MEGSKKTFKPSLTDYSVVITLFVLGILLIWARFAFGFGYLVATSIGIALIALGVIFALFKFYWRSQKE